MAETLVPSGTLMQRCPTWLQGWISLGENAVYKWCDDRAPTMGAAIAYDTVFSLAPMLVIVIAIAGLAFGQKAAEGALFGELANLIGPESAVAVQGMLRSVSGARSGVLATAIGIGTLVIAATAVLGELQSALNVIWKAPASKGLGIWHLLKSRLVSLAVILVIGFLLLVSLVISTALAAFSGCLDWLLPGLATILDIAHLILSFALTTVLFCRVVQNSPGLPGGVAGGLARRDGRSPAVHARQAPDQPLYRQQQHGLDLRRCRCADHRLGMGLLLGPDPFARCRVCKSVQRSAAGAP
jgi:uncharacterized BrkB/YihY/UPF0761 family membrane protein